MKPDELKQWRQRLSLGEVGMAAYLGVPRNTYVKWENGQRSPDSSTRRLFEVLRMIEELEESTCAQIHDGMVSSARSVQGRADAPKRKGRPPKAAEHAKLGPSDIHRAMSCPSVSPAPAAQASDIPAWLINSHP